jgi:RNA polymerase sigma factor (sigma-70 family)
MSEDSQFDRISEQFATWKDPARTAAEQAAARGELIGLILKRFRGRAQRLLHGSGAPDMSTGSVLSEAAIELLEHLDAEKTPNLRAFLRYAAEKVRFAVLTLLRERQKFQAASLNATPPGDSSSPGRNEPVADVTPPSGRPRRAEIEQLLQEQIQNMPEEDQELFDQHVNLGLSLTDVSHSMGVDRETAKTCWRRIRRALMKDDRLARALGVEP